MDLEVKEKGELDVVVVQSNPTTLKRQNSCFHTTEMATYHMESKPRGLALIIEIEKFENDVQEQRVGSQVLNSVVSDKCDDKFLICISKLLDYSVSFLHNEGLAWDLVNWS